MSKNGKYYCKEAAKHGLKVENGKGDHVKIYGPAGRGYMVVPIAKELDKGLECAIKKWFKALGIVLTILLILYAIHIWAIL